MPSAGWLAASGETNEGGAAGGGSSGGGCDGEAVVAGLDRLPGADGGLRLQQAAVVVFEQAVAEAHFARERPWAAPLGQSPERSQAAMDAVQLVLACVCEGATRGGHGQKRRHQLAAAVRMLLGTAPAATLHKLQARCTCATHALHVRCTCAARALHMRCAHAAHALHMRCSTRGAYPRHPLAHASGRGGGAAAAPPPRRAALAAPRSAVGRSCHGVGRSCRSPRPTH